RLLLAVRARPDDGRVSRQRLVLRRPGERPPGHLRVAHRRREARGAPPVRARRQRGQQEEGREVAVRRSQSLVPTLREDPADADPAALDRSYAAHERAYRRIFDRCRLRYWVVQSDTGMMGGLGSHEFMAPAAAGEDEIAICGGCGYAANVEVARGVPVPPAFPAWAREEVATPGARAL